MNFMTLDLPKLKQEAISPEFVTRQLRENIRSLYRQMVPTLAGDAAGFDAVTAMSIRNVEQVLAETIETIYGPLKAEQFIPMGTAGVDPFIDEYVYERVDRQGMADWILTGDMPWIDVSTEEVRRKVHNLGGKVGWSFFDIEAARAGGKPLDTMKLNAARQSVDASRNLIMLSGDTGLPSGGGLVPTGLFNDPDVPVVPAPNGAFSGRTEDEVVEDMLALWATYDTNVRESMNASHIILPPTQYHQLMRRMDGTDGSLRRYLLDNLPGLQSIEQAQELATAGVGGATRMVIYNRSPQVLQGVVPMSFRTFAPENMQLQTTVCAAERLAGLQVKFAPGVLYADGV